MSIQKCLICRNIILEITTQMLQHIDQIICQDCSETIKQSVHQLATEIYPKLVEDIQLKYGRVYRKNFEEYCNDRIRDILHDHYYKKIIKKKYTNERDAILKCLPKTLTSRQIKELKTNALCALSGTTDDVTMDHFIPIEWGHGGEYIGNIFFLNRKLNASKSSKNPFNWIKSVSTSEIIDMSYWSELVVRLAADNGLNITDFKHYVDWCEKNKRSIAQLNDDNTPSLKLWRLKSK
jgi:hypothetical protein